MENLKAVGLRGFAFRLKEGRKNNNLDFAHRKDEFHTGLSFRHFQVQTTIFSCPKGFLKNEDEGRLHDLNSKDEGSRLARRMKDRGWPLTNESLWKQRNDDSGSEE